MTFVADDFNRPDASDLGPGWVSHNGILAIADGLVYPTSSPNYTWCYSSSTTIMATDDMEASFTVGPTNSTTDHLLIYVGANATGQCLFIYFYQGGAYFFTQSVWASYGLVYGPVTLAQAEGDTLTVRRVGTTYSILKNGAATGISYATAAIPIDASHREVGFAIYSDNGSARRTVDSFEARDLTRLTGVTYSQSSVYDWLPSATYAGMNDGDASGSDNQTATDGGDEWLMADLGSVRHVSYLVIGADYEQRVYGDGTPWTGGYGALYASFRPVDVSTDGSTWTYIGDTPDYTSVGAANGLNYFHVGSDARYVRIGAPGGWLCITEFQVWGGEVPVESLPVTASLAGGGTLSATVEVVTPPSSGFAPTDLSGCTVWLDATQLSSLTTQWPDLSGNNHHGAVVGTPAPTIENNSPYGLPVVRFKANEGRVRGSGMYPAATPNSSFTVMFVGRQWGPTIGRIFSNPYPPFNFLVGTHASGRNSCFDAGWINSGTGWTTPPTPWTTWGFVYHGSPNLGTFFVDGVDSGSSAGGGGHDDRWNLSGYSDTGGEESCDVEVAELVIYDRDLTTAERQQVEEYLHDKWFEEGGGPEPIPVAAAFSGGGSLSATVTASYPASASLAGSGTLSATVHKWASPADTLGLGLWLDASQLTGFADGEDIWTWSDASSAARHATAGDSLKPRYRPAGLNGHPAVDFSSGVRRMRIPTFGTALSGKTEYTLFYVAKVASFGYSVIATAPPDTLWRWLLEYEPSGGFYWGHGNGYFRQYYATMATNTPYALTFLHAPSGPHYYINGSEAIGYYLGGSGDIQATVPNVDGDVILGAYYEGSYPVDGVIAEFIWYDHALTTAERLQVEGYLNEKYFGAAPSTPVSVDFSGGGTLGATASESYARAPALAGSGTLSATVTPVIPKTVPLSGSGTLSASVMKVAPVAAALTGSGALVPAVSQKYSLTAALAGAGTFSGTARASYARTTALAGDGTLSATAIVYVPPVWSPLDLPGLGAWIDPSQDLGIYTDGQAITSYISHDPGAKVFNSLASYEPHFKTAAVNGKPRIEFVSTGSAGDLLRYDSYNPGTTGLTFVFVSQTVPAVYGMMMTWNGNAHAYELRNLDSGQGVQIVGDYGGGGPATTSSTVRTLGVDCILIMRVDMVSHTIKLYIDGVLEFSVGSVASMPNVASNLSIGERVPDGYYWSGLVAEALVLSGPISDSDRVSLTTYLQDKHFGAGPPPSAAPAFGGGGSLSATVTPVIPKTVPLSGSGTLSASVMKVAPAAAALSGGGILSATVEVASAYGPDERMIDDSLPVNFYAGDYTLGMRFTPAKDGRITHIRCYVEGGTHKFSLWNTATTAKLVSVTGTSSGPRAWQQAELPTPFNVVAGTGYTVTCSTDGLGYGFSPMVSSLSPNLTNLQVFYGVGSDVFPTVDGAPNHNHVDVIYQEYLGTSGEPGPTPVAAALTGSGSLSAIVAPRLPVTVDLIGGGALSATRIPLFSRTAALAGAGALTETHKQVYSVPGSLAGGGSLTASAVKVVPGTAAPTLEGEGTLSAQTKQIQAVTAALYGDGSLMAFVPIPSVDYSSGGWTVSPPTPVPVSRQGWTTTATTVSEDPKQGWVGAGVSVKVTARPTGAGLLTAALMARPFKAALLAGNGALFTALLQREFLAMGLSGDGALSGTLTKVEYLFPQFSGTGFVFGDTVSTHLEPEFSGSGELRGDIDGLTATVYSIYLLNALFGGEGTLLGDYDEIHRVNMNFAGAGTLTGPLVPKLIANLAGSGAFSASVLAGYFRTAALLGSGTLSATDFASYLRSIGFTGPGNLAGLLQPLFTPSGGGEGTVSALVNQRYILPLYLVSQPGFENDAYWTFPVGTQTTEQAHSGTKSHKLTGAGAYVQFVFSSNPNGNGNYIYVPSAPGRKVAASAWLRRHPSNTNTGNVYIRMIPRDAAQVGFASIQTAIPVASIPNNGWEQFSVSGTLPANTADFYPDVLLGNDVPSGDVFYVDDVWLDDGTCSLSGGGTLSASPIASYQQAASLSGGGALSATFAQVPVPAITNITAAQFWIGNTITVTGSGFTAPASVTVGGVAATSVNVTSSTSLTCVIPSVGMGQQYVQVSTAAGFSNSFPITVVPKFTFDTVSPSTGAYDTTITLGGNGFTGVSSVTIGGQAVRNLSVVNDTTITCTPPGLNNGTYDVAVTSASAGTLTKTSAFTYSFTPISETNQAKTAARPAGTSGCWVTLIGAGGGAGTGHGAAFTACGGGGGGGGAGTISRSFIGAASLGSTYTVVRPTGSTAAGAATTFSSGSVSLSANGGGKGGNGGSGTAGAAGAAGTTTVSGATVSTINGGAGAAGAPPTAAGPAATNQTTACPGGGGGGGRTGGGGVFNGGKGGNSSFATGGAGSSGTGGTGGNASPLPGNPGGGGGGGGSTNGTGSTGGPAGDYGAGGGGGGGGNSTGPAGAGGDGYSLIEWV